MAQWARNNPELFEQGIGYLDHHADLADRDDFARRGTRTPRLCARCGQLIQGSIRHTVSGVHHFPNCPEVG